MFSLTKLWVVTVKLADDKSLSGEKPVNSKLESDKVISSSTGDICIISGEEKWPNINGGTCYGKDQMIALYGECDMNGYTTSGFPSSWTITELYERDENWSKNDMINAINAGQNIVFHTGHSNNFMIMKLWMSYDDVAKLRNTAYFIDTPDGIFYESRWTVTELVDKTKKASVLISVRRWVMLQGKDLPR